MLHGIRQGLLEEPAQCVAGREKAETSVRDNHAEAERVFVDPCLFPLGVAFRDAFFQNVAYRSVRQRDPFVPVEQTSAPSAVVAAASAKLTRFHFVTFAFMGNSFSFCL
jgi:hypothetical protein